MRRRHRERAAEGDAPTRPAWIERRGDRLALVREAGWGRLSWFSIAAGVLAAYGAFVLVLGVVSAVLKAVGVDTDELSKNDWKRLGTGAGIVLALVLFAAYLFGGYVAGRMARRSGFLHGLLVFAFGVVVLVAVAAVVSAENGTDAIINRLDSLGVPTSRNEWTGIGSVAGVVSIAGMLLGGLFGGALGERWHQRLATRALDPGVGPDAERRAEAERLRKAAERAEARAQQAGAVTAADETEIDLRTDADRTEPAPPASPQASLEEERQRTRGEQPETGVMQPSR